LQQLTFRVDEAGGDFGAADIEDQGGRRN